MSYHMEVSSILDTVLGLLLLKVQGYIQEQAPWEFLHNWAIFIRFLHVNSELGRAV